jgi:hypothetical protein
LKRLQLEAVCIMEGREGQDGDAVRRSGVFSGRQVPLEMGTVRVGGSGRPVPALFAAAASRRAGASAQEAGAASTSALSPRVAFEVRVIEWIDACMDIC